MTDPITAQTALARLKHQGKKSVVAGMARYGIPSTNAVGVTVGDVKRYAKTIGRDHALSGELWKSGVYEARLLAAFVGEPDRVTGVQMDRWASDFDSWAVCDTVCFALCDRAPLAWSKVKTWAGTKPEFKKRGAFALLWGLTVHDKDAPDRQFLDCLPLIERAALDERDYVKKGIDMSLRALGKRNPSLRVAALNLAKILTQSTEGPQSWIGRSTIRDLSNAKARSG